MAKERDDCGRFIQMREPWTSEAWDDGYVDNNGRFRVYRPDYPRAYALGYALRAHVVWWLETGNVHPPELELHHRDEDRLNDTFHNLEPLTRSEHRKRHQPKRIGNCSGCGDPFVMKWYGSRYCSASCYHRSGKSVETRERIGASLRSAYSEGRR